MTTLNDVQKGHFLTLVLVLPENLVQVIAHSSVCNRHDNGQWTGKTTISSVGTLSAERYCVYNRHANAKFRSKRTLSNVGTGFAGKFGTDNCARNRHANGQ